VRGARYMDNGNGDGVKTDKNSSGYDVANVNVFSTTSYMFIKYTILLLQASAYAPDFV